MGYYNLINKIKNMLKEDTTMSTISYLPSQVGVVKAFIGDLSKEKDDWDLEVLDGKDYKSVKFGGKSSINVLHKYWDSFNKLFGGKLEHGKSLKVKGLFEANVDELKAIRSELMRAIHNFFNFRKFKVLRLIYTNFRNYFKVNNTSSPRYVVALNDIDRGILDLYGKILKEYGEDRGTLEMMVTAFQEQKPLGKFTLFGKNDFICGLKAESRTNGVTLVLELGIDINDVGGSIQQSLYVGNPNVIDEIKDRKDVKTVKSMIYPVGGIFTESFFKDLHELIMEN